MMQGRIELKRLAIGGLLVLTPRVYRDDRGTFSETYSKSLFEEIGLAIDFVQDNCSHSDRPGVLRGLHFQAPPFAQAKLVRVARGKVLDVAVDLRAGSPTYGRHAAVELSAENGCQLFVPVGFAHGFLTLTPETDVNYKVSCRYAPESESGLVWNDPDLAIEWPIDAESVIVSDRDRGLGRFESFVSPFAYELPGEHEL